MKVADTYKEPITMTLPGANIRIFVPELSPEENARRMKAIHDAAADLLKSRKTR